MATPECLTVRDLRAMTDQDLDALAFGAIELDENDIVISYNQAEAELAQRSPEHTIGKNFFTEVAPCTDTPGFRGVLEDMKRNNEETRAVDYTFSFPWGERLVRVRFLRNGPSVWVFVTPLQTGSRG